MDYLLDTHTLLWALDDNPTLTPAARFAIVDGDNTVYVSAVCVWEIAIKKALGKLSAPDTLLKDIADMRLVPLEITLEHVDLAGTLPPLHTARSTACSSRKRSWSNSR